MPLSDQARINIARWAQEYIEGLIENHRGHKEDVHSIIDELHDQSTLGGHHGPGSAAGELVHHRLRHSERT